MTDTATTPATLEEAKTTFEAIFRQNENLPDTQRIQAMRQPLVDLYIAHLAGGNINGAADQVREYIITLDPSKDLGSLDMTFAALQANPSSGISQAFNDAINALALQARREAQKQRVFD
jgi:hypothetical protein